MTKRRAEPILWLSFSGGGVMAAVFLPVLMLLFGVIFPLGWLDPPEHDHLLAVASHPITLIVLLGVFVMCLIHAAHRLRFTLQHALRVERGRTALARACYTGAFVGAVATVLVLWNLATS